LKKTKIPGPKPGYKKPPPKPKDRMQKTIRLDHELAERAEARALEETLRLGVEVCFSDLVRRGLELVIAQGLPPMRREMRPCDLVRSPVEGCSFCTRCSKTVNASDTCPRDGEAVPL
jgi:hypothetical protein